jgi:hypothetical protein
MIMQHTKAQFLCAADGPKLGRSGDLSAFAASSLRARRTCRRNYQFVPRVAYRPRLGADIRVS